MGVASGLAGEHLPARSTRRQFMRHGQWHRPSAPLHFMKKEEGRKTNKQRLHRDHTHGVEQQGQAVPSWRAPMMLAPDPHRWLKEELGPIGPAGLSPGPQPCCPPVPWDYGLESFEGKFLLALTRFTLF